MLSRDTPATLGLFGGTFDPVHLGHTGTIQELRSLTGLVDVRFVPAAVPPHRDQPGASPAQRLDMVRLATAGLEGISVDARELDRGGPSFTVDTLEQIRTELPDRPMCLVLGLDAALGLPKWHRWQDILNIAGILVMVRPDYALPDPLPDWWQSMPESDALVTTGKMRLVPVTPNLISATLVRDTIRRGEDPAPMLHADVWRYIQTHHLYRDCT